MLKEFLMRKMLERKLAQLPEGQREKITSALQKDPDFFANLAKEIEVEKKAGKNDMAAAMVVMQRHKDKLQGLLG